jgi:hypothetical protein
MNPRASGHDWLYSGRIVAIVNFSYSKDTKFDCTQSMPQRYTFSHNRADLRKLP